MTEIMLRHVPNCWQTKRLGQLFRERKERVNDRDFPPLSVTKSGIHPQLDTAAKTEDGDNRKCVRSGDFVINSRSDRKGSSGLSKFEGSVSLISIVLEPVGIHPRFAQHLLKSQAFQEEFYRWGHGIVADLWTTRYSEMKNIRLGIPDPKMQVEIADFLDRETARIDQLIEKKQRLQDLMRERSTAAIENALATEKKPTKLGHHVRILPGYAFPSADFSHNESDVRLLRGANVAPGATQWKDVVYWPRNLMTGLERFQLSAGDIVMGMDRPWISEGIRVAELQPEDVPALLLQRVCKIIPLKTILKSYLQLLLRSRRFLGYFEPELTGVSVPHISGEQIANFRFGYMDLDEQRVRADHCLSILAIHRRISVAEQTSIERLHEFRSAVITAAVTGQIDIAIWRRCGETDARCDAIEAEVEARA